MRSVAITASIFAILFNCARAAEAKSTQPIIVIHGGCGVDRNEVTKDDEPRYHKALEAALQAGYAILNKGGSAVDAVEAAVKSMEDSREFNAGAGAVFDHDGHNTLDASIMDGKTHDVGSVAGVTIVKNPIEAALAVMRKSKHVMFIGEGANKFAREQKLEIVKPNYFYTDVRWHQLQQYLKREKAGKKAEDIKIKTDHRYGTVGAVALDSQGNLAAATSTGGLTGKRWGRVGDSPIIGAGTYADNDSCAVSCTGDGEWFIRFNVASDISARVKYKGTPLKEAANQIIHGVLGPGRGEGGTIALDKDGNFATPYNTEGMFRGYMYNETPHTFIFDGDTAGSAGQNETSSLNSTSISDRAVQSP
jgi:beta-aspartyl-peptidase (threonine type)